MKMRLPCLFIFITLYGFNVTSAISNDIVGSFRCKFLCKAANGYSHEISEENICNCKIRNKLSDKKLARIQELSTFYKLPVLLDWEHAKHKVKRQLDVNLLEDLQTKYDEHKQLWDENVENIKKWHERQADESEPLLGDIAPKWDEHRRQWEDKMKTWKEEQFDPLLEDIAPNLDEQKRQFEETLQSWKEDHIEPLFEDIAPKLEEQKQQRDENLQTWKDEHVEPLLGQIASKFDEHKQQWEENMENLKEWQAQQAEPILGQMAPSLTTYDSQGTGIGGSNVNFPPPNHPNPFVPGLAHILNALPVRFNVPVGSSAPAAPAPRRLLPNLLRPRLPAPLLPSRFNAPYNPSNPIVVQPIVLPHNQLTTPKPILHSLRDSVDGMLQNMKKNGGRLVPENYLNSDALSNSESQVNQINVNVRVEPTPPPPNMFSFFLPWNRNWLAAPAPKDLQGADGDEVTDNPGVADRTEEDEAEDDDNEENGESQKKQPNNDQHANEEEDVEEEMRMQKQLKDADHTKFEAHIADSVKKNLPSAENSRQASDKDDAEEVDDEEELNGGKYNNNGLIVQPKQFMQDTDEDLETLAK